jgi:hypothetical protein
MEIEELRNEEAFDMEQKYQELYEEKEQLHQVY